MTSATAVLSGHEFTRRRGRGGDRGNQHTGGKVPEGDIATLTDMSVSRNQSSRWQQLAEHSNKDFEKALNKAGANGVPTTSGVLRNLGVTIDNDEPPSDPKSAKALWIWGRLIPTCRPITPLHPPPAPGCREMKRLVAAAIARLDWPTNDVKRATELKAVK